MARIKARDWSAVPVGAFLIILGNGDGVDFGSRIFWPGYVEANTLHQRLGNIQFRPATPRPGDDAVFTFGRDEIKELYWPLSVDGTSATPGPDKLSEAATSC